MADVNNPSDAAAAIFSEDLGIKQPESNIQTPPVETPIVETPVTPVVETPATPVTPPIETPKSDIIFEEESKVETPTFDETKYLTELFGTADKTVIKDKFSKYDDVNKQLEEAALKLAQPKYNNKVAEVLDEILSKTGGDINTNKDFVKNTLDLLTTDEKALDPLSLVKFHLRTQYPNMDSTLLDAHIKQTYMQGDDFTTEQQEAGKAKLAMDAHVAQTALGELKAKALTNDTSKQVALQKLQEEKRQTEWVAPVKKVVEDFKTIKLSLGKIGGKNAFVNFDVPSDIAKGYEQVVYNSMLQTGGLPNEESISTAQQTLRALYIADNLDAITSHIASKLQSDGVKKEIEQYHNPSAQGTAQQRQEVRVQKTEQEILAESIGWKRPN